MSVLSGMMNYDAAGKAAEAQKESAQDSADMQYKMYMQGREDTAPWRAAGANALSTLQSKINAGPGDFRKDPGYDFRLREGQRGLEASNAARGGIGGGRMAKEMTRYGQDYASNEYQNYLNRYYQSLTPLQSLAGVGQTSAAQGAQNALQTGLGMGLSAMYGGNAAAGGYINQANAITGAGQSGLNTYLAWKNSQTQNPYKAPNVGATPGQNYSQDYGLDSVDQIY